MRIPKRPPPFPEVIRRIFADDRKFLGELHEAPIRDLVARADDEGWNWEKCGHYSNSVGLTPEKLWALVKMARIAYRKDVPLCDLTGEAFSYRLPAFAQRMCHQIDMQLGGSVGSAFGHLSSDDDQKRYLLASLREEAISSSLIEGAVATRDQAEEMIRKSRAPQTPGEQMILNNYRTIRYLNSKKDQPLTIELLCHVQRLLTQDTDVRPDAQGRLRLPSETITVCDEEDDQVLHVTPDASTLPTRLQLLCDFANVPVGVSATGEFVHPAIRSIILHFWLAYDHPFVDGNGRTARALFYWSMLRHGYWLAEYLTISTIIAGQPKQYARAYLDTERDDNDLTYFLLYHLRVVERSMEAFREYLARKQADNRKTALVVSGHYNSRQRAILQRAMRDPTVHFTYESHAQSHGISLPTARTDLLELEKLGLLRGNRVGRQYEFAPAPNIAAILRRLSRNK